MILIRADANEQIGSGHVMRCMSIATALEEMGEQVQFVTADHKGDKLVEQKGFKHICLNTDWKQMDGEVECLKRILGEKKPSIILVDSYFVTESYFKEINRFVKIAYIDDFGGSCWKVNWLINYNVYSTTLDYSCYDSANIKMILGAKFAPLRNEFSGIPQHEIKEDISNVLISAGGSDPEKITEKFISRVCPMWESINFHFVVGALNPRIESIKSLEKDNVVMHINEKNMSKLMMDCDVAISAAGTTLYELCACGIPTITYVLADNQIQAAREFEKQGIMINAGDCRGNESFVDNCNKLFSGLSVEKRRKLSLNMHSLVDGYGAERIAELLV